ncbi:MAG: hypothetical protein JO222_02410 [Frankiales bacterium]|nr:hypothetical protein [Frankiales bacterium]
MNVSRNIPWRRHAFFAGLFAAGVVMRVVTMIGYGPILANPDSKHYLSSAQHIHLSKLRPVGYSFFLWPFVNSTNHYAVIAGVQHLLGLALAVAIYAWLLRRGLPSWAAALAAVPVLLDPLQLFLEQEMLADLLFEVLLVVACLALLWRHRPGWLDVGLAGLCIGYASTVRGNGAVLVAVLVVTVAVLRAGWAKLALATVAALVPLVAYAVAYHHAFGTYSVSSDGPRFLYARLAPHVECKGLHVPSYEKSLCPNVPLSQRLNSDQYMWTAKKRSPQYHLPKVPGKTAVQVVKDWDRRVIRAEPLMFARVTTIDFLRGFRPTRTQGAPGFSAQRWLFQDHLAFAEQYGGMSFSEPLASNVGINRGVARFMYHYNRDFYLPGPLAAALLLVGLVATLGFGRARWSGDRIAIGLMLASLLATLVSAAAVAGASWRYELPQLVLIPPAAALGIRALFRGGPPPESVVPVLAPARAVVAAVVAGVVSAGVLLASGWAGPAVAVVIGLVVSAAAGAGLLRARRPAPVGTPGDEPVGEPVGASG